ncbi:MAG: hypothetical protein H0W64_10945 [Gammaproteobacteria bacterium]|nr:hypothetical protein [Gammaproteobacteria bacterium]
MNFHNIVVHAVTSPKRRPDSKFVGMHVQIVLHAGATQKQGIENGEVRSFFLTDAQQKELERIEQEEKTHKVTLRKERNKIESQTRTQCFLRTEDIKR